MTTSVRIKFESDASDSPVMAKYPKPDLGSDEGDLSDIDDEEISGCLNDTREAELKAKVWNLMHCQNAKRKRELEKLPPDARKKTKADSSAAARKNNEKQAKSTSSSLSSKIDFQALEKFMEDGAGKEKNDEEPEKLESGEDGEEVKEYSEEGDGGGDDYGNDVEEEEEDYGDDRYSENEDDDYELY